jgi:isoleucyl-tRNA synthetase
MLVRPRDAADRAVLQEPELVQQVLEEVNVKELRLIDDERSLIESTVKPNFKALGPRYGTAMKAVAAHLSGLDAGPLEEAFARDGAYRFELDGQTIEVLPGDVTLQRSGPPNLVFTFEAGMFAALDTTVTPELEREGIARDFNRHGQEQRKALDLQITDRVVVEFAGSDRVREAVAEHEELLRDELLADRIEAVTSLTEGAEAKIAGETVRLALRKAG